jgi:hypothetical protein
VRRWPAADAIKPWQFRSWIAPRAPDFAATAAVVLDLYARVWNGKPLGPGGATRLNEAMQGQQP